MGGQTAQLALIFASCFLGAIAQLGERYTGSVEVGGSIPPGSTKQNPARRWGRIFYKFNVPIV